MVANILTITRTFLTFGVIAGFGRHHRLDIGLIFTIAFIFILDALDGIVARKRNETSKLGEVLDTLADRIVENTFWVYFTAVGQIPVWMPITVMARGFITDALQRRYGYPKNGWMHALTRSRVSRALFGITKMSAFTILASATVFKTPVLEKVGLILVIIAVGFCLLRGIPFFFISRNVCMIENLTPNAELDEHTHPAYNTTTHKPLTR